MMDKTINEVAADVAHARGHTPRPEVAAFSELMERELRLNDHKGGWRKMQLGWLMARLRREVEELDCALYAKDAEMIETECADVANFAMMIADIVRDSRRTV